MQRHNLPCALALTAMLLPTMFHIGVKATCLCLAERSQGISRVGMFLPTMFHIVTDLLKATSALLTGYAKPCLQATLSSTCLLVEGSSFYNLFLPGA
jgi:hypothetical protein